jgi:hypothetical protein
MMNNSNPSTVMQNAYYNSPNPLTTSPITQQPIQLQRPSYTPTKQYTPNSNTQNANAHTQMQLPQTQTSPLPQQQFQPSQASYMPTQVPFQQDSFQQGHAFQRTQSFPHTQSLPHKQPTLSQNQPPLSQTQAHHGEGVNNNKLLSSPLVTSNQFSITQHNYTGVQQNAQRAFGTQDNATPTKSNYPPRSFLPTTAIPQTSPATHQTASTMSHGAPSTMSHMAPSSMSHTGSSTISQSTPPHAQQHLPPKYMPMSTVSPSSVGGFPPLTMQPTAFLSPNNPNGISNPLQSMNTIQPTNVMQPNILPPVKAISMNTIQPMNPMNSIPPTTVQPSAISHPSATTITAPTQADEGDEYEDEGEEDGEDEEGDEDGEAPAASAPAFAPSGVQHAARDRKRLRKKVC